MQSNAVSREISGTAEEMLRATNAEVATAQAPMKTTSASYWPRSAIRLREAAFE